MVSQKIADHTHFEGKGTRRRISCKFHNAHPAGFLHPVVAVVVAATAAADPDDPGPHPVGDDGLGGVAVREYHEAVIAVLMGVFDGLLEGGAAAADGDDVPHYLPERLHHPDAGVELDNVDRRESVTEGAVDHPVEMRQVPRGDGAADVHRDEQFGVETTDGSHILEPRAAVGPHPREFALRRKDARTETRQDVAPVDAGAGGRFDHLGEMTRQGAPVPGGIDDSVDHRDGHLILLPEFRKGFVPGRVFLEVLRAAVLIIASPSVAAPLR